MSTKHRRGALRARKADLIARLGPDRSRTIYSFADAWTIRRVESLADQLREGEMLRHCLRDLSEPASNCFSLRDRHGLPHATFAAWSFDTSSEPAFPSLPGWCMANFVDELGLLWGRWAVMRGEGHERGKIASHYQERLREFAATPHSDLSPFPAANYPAHRFELLFDSAVPPSTPAYAELAYLKRECLERLVLEAVA